MSYNRVIPRDLFNEANLLKCYGQLYLELDKLNLPNVTLDHEGDTFEVWQYSNDGSTTLTNVFLNVGGGIFELWRPLNSRGAYPLLMRGPEDDIAVFDDDGTLSTEMLNFLKGQ